MRFRFEAIFLRMRRNSARDFAMEIILDVLRSTGITATAGVGTNLYLCKIAMDIVAKHIPADENGVRIAELNEMQYRQLLWSHRPLTDFWRIGKGYARKLEAHGMRTMGDVARTSLRDEDLLYKLFGVNAELLIDHAWGWEGCTIADIKAYKPDAHSISAGQVLTCPYPCEKARLVVREMAEALALELVDKGLAAGQVVLDVGYEHLGAEEYAGEVKADRYGRRTPKPAHGSARLARRTHQRRFRGGSLQRVQRASPAGAGRGGRAFPLAGRCGAWRQAQRDHTDRERPQDPGGQRAGRHPRRSQVAAGRAG